mmetsp:Transcript_37799/g.67760  ORF Transcript_37799/g.67760 Transcript_37799/m.67760 type:complete len:901 (-) Transcript_37799:390-3092(-)
MPAVKMGAKSKKRVNKSTMWLAKGMAKMMLSNKDTEILANNLKKLPPQRTPPELDRLQNSAKGLPIFKALENTVRKSRELCRVLKLKEIGRHEQWVLRDEHMLVVLLYGEIIASTVDKEPLENTLSGEPDDLERAMGMEIPNDELGQGTSTGDGGEVDEDYHDAGVTDYGVATSSPSSSSRVIEAPPAAEVAGMSLSDWQRVFEQTDEDGSGSLSSTEIYTMLRNCKIDVAFDDVEHLVLELDDDRSLELEFEEFAMLITKLTQGSDSSSWRMKQGFGWQHSFKAGAFFGETSLLDDDSGMNATLEAVGGAGAKFMVLDRRSFQAVMREGFEAYMTERVEFLKGHCQLFHGLNRLSDLKSIAFLADEEAVPDGDVILRQGATADTAVIITSGACKLLVRLEQRALEEAAIEAGWQAEGGSGSGSVKSQMAASKLRGTQRSPKAMRTVELAEIHYGELCGESAILQTPTYYAGLVATHGTTVVRLPVEPLLQYLHKPDVVRLQEFCRMRMQFRQQQLQSKALSLLSSSNQAAAFVQQVQIQEATRAEKVKDRWIPGAALDAARASPLTVPADQNESFGVPGYKTPQQIRREAGRDVMEAYRSANLKDTFKDILARATSGMDASLGELQLDISLMGRSSSVELGALSSYGAKNATSPSPMKPFTTAKGVNARSLGISSNYMPMRTLAVDEDIVGRMLDDYALSASSGPPHHIEVTLPKARTVPALARSPCVSSEGDGNATSQLPLFPSDYPTFDAMISQSHMADVPQRQRPFQPHAPSPAPLLSEPTGKRSKSNGRSGRQVRTDIESGEDNRKYKSHRDMLPPAVGLRTAKGGRKPHRLTDPSDGVPMAMGIPHGQLTSIQRQAGGQRMGNLRQSGRLVNPLAVGPRNVPPQLPSPKSHTSS